MFIAYIRCMHLLASNISRQIISTSLQISVAYLQKLHSFKNKDTFNGNLKYAAV
jgi:hypothetical protein